MQSSTNRVREMRHMKLGGKTYAQIAKQFKVSRQRVAQLLAVKDIHQRHLMERCGRVCERCGQNVLLSIHHVNYNKRSKIHLLCNSCHSQAHRGGHKRSRRRSQFLSDRQVQILMLLGSGGTNEGMAAALAIGVKTVEKHRGRLFLKLNVSNAAHAIVRAVQLGYVTITDTGIERETRLA